MPIILLPLVGAIASLTRIPALVMFISVIMGNLISWFAKFFTKKVAMQLTIITAIVAATTVFFTAIKGAVGLIAIYTPPEVDQAVSMFIPDNASVCVSVYISCRLIRWAYTWQVRFIEMMAHV